jgi:hypothetical protein
VLRAGDRTVWRVHDTLRKVDGVASTAVLVRGLPDRRLGPRPGAMSNRVAAVATALLL